MITLHDLNKPEVRVAVREAGLVLFVDPHTGNSQVVAGAAACKIAKPPGAGTVHDASISVESESFELELATAAVLAIRGHVDDDDAEALRPLAETILDYWTRGLPVPWTEMLAP